jgi:endo-1,4-beta-xylanase
VTVTTGWFLCLFMVLTQASTFASDPRPTKSDDETLREYADKLGIGIGAAIQGRYWNQDPQFRAIVGKEFNRAVSIIPMRFTEPERDRFDLAGMDRDMQFAREHNMKLFGTALIYRNPEAGSWLRFNTENCGGWSPADLDQIMKKYIQTVVRHGGDTYFAWDVVNEPTAPFHNRCWSSTLGYEETIAKAFRYAREANPDTLLVINETFGHAGVDRQRADNFLDLIKRLKSQGVPIDVAGTEMHLEADQLHPNYVDEFKYFLDRARKLSVQVHITELDVYQGPPGAFPDPSAKQKDIYYTVVHTCVQDSNCKSITVFGATDKYSWLRTVREMPDASPLLFDDNYRKKPAYYGVLQALKEGR